MNARRVWAFYGFSFFTHLLPLYAVYTVIINDEFRSPLVLSTLLAVWSLTVVVLEVPSGALADYWNKKHVALIGQASKLITCCIWFLFRSYPAFLAGFVFWGIQESFCSGSVEALLYEEAEKHGGDAVFERLYARCYRLTTIAVTAAIFAGGYLYRVREELVFVISIATSAAALVFTAFLPSTPDSERSREKHSYLRIIRGALAQAGRNAVIVRLFLYSVLYATVIGTVEEYIPVYLQSLGFTAVAFSLGLGLVLAAQMVGGFASGLVRLKGERAQYAAAAVSCVCLGAVHFAGPVLSIVLLFLVFAVIGVLEIKLSAALNDAIGGERATVLSLQSLSMNAAAVVFAVGIGAIADAAGLSASFLSFAAASAVALGVLAAAAGRSAHAHHERTDP